MGAVVLDISTSLDGFATAATDGRDSGLGDGGEVLHYGVFGGSDWRAGAFESKRTGASKAQHWGLARNVRV